MRERVEDAGGNDAEHADDRELFAVVEFTMRRSEPAACARLRASRALAGCLYLRGYCREGTRRIPVGTEWWMRN